MLSDNSTDKKTKFPKEQARAVFQKAFGDGWVSYPKHCRQRMQEREINVNDLIKLSKSGTVRNEPELHMKTNDWTYTIESSTGDLKVVFVIHEENGNQKVRVVTLMRDY